MAVIARAEVTLARVDYDETTQWHFWHDEEGAHVTEGERPAEGEPIVGKNVLLTGDGLQVRDGSTVLASFEDSLIELGRNSARSVIELCGGEVRLSYGSNGDLTVSRGMTLTGPAIADGLASNGYLSVGAPMYLGLGQRNALRCFVSGTVVVTISGGTAVLFSASQYKTLVGRAYKAGDVVLCANGDRDANALGPAASYRPSSGAWYVNVPGASSGASAYRVNYLIVAVY